jgi:release factor glutamine methyltransferase
LSAGKSITSLVQSSGLPLLEAQVLAAHALGLARAALLADGQRVLDAEAARRVERLFLRRRAGEPVAYLTGEREFYGLSLKITPDVLIPRPETELLVDLALERLPNRAGRVLDLGTGSGAIAVALAHAAPDAEVVAVEASRAAVAIARENAARHGVGIRFVDSEWFAGLVGERFDVIVSNPPYVAAGDSHLGEGDLRFEPRTALAAGPDGLDAIRAIVAGANSHLVAGGWLLFEHGFDQAERCRSLLAMYGYAGITSWPDLAGITRVSGARAAGA